MTERWARHGNKNDQGKHIEREGEHKLLFPHVVPGRDWEEENGWTEDLRSDILQLNATSDYLRLPDEAVGYSLGAKRALVDILDLETEEHFTLVEGTYLQNVEVFAGKGVKKAYNKAFRYAEKYGGIAADWQHVKAIAVIDYYGESRRAEIHWSQCEGFGKQEFFIKEWLE